MRKIFGAVLCAGILALPLAATADEARVPSPRDVMQAEGTPPLIPHRVTEQVTYRQCLGCHEEGKKGAPVTPHPERQTCTQCHLPADGFSPVRAGRKK